MDNKTIVMLASDCAPTNILYHAINAEFPITKVIIEERESKKVFIRRRIKRQGFFTVAGQVLFQMFVVKLMQRTSRSKVKKIMEDGDMNESAIPSNKLIHVISANQQSVRELLLELKPDVIIVNGTRILSKKLLAAINSPFINTHVGITPKYRGVHGGYWALANNDAANFGVTVHLVDPGVDTGDILYQAKVTVNKTDNFITYPLHQLHAGIPLLRQAIDDALQQQLHPVPTSGESKVWYHPTIWQYLYNRISKKVK